MAIAKPFPYAECLAALESIGASAPAGDTSLPAPLARTPFDAAGEQFAAVHRLIPLLGARKAMWQAAFDTEQVADELRRYQKFAKPGQPSPQVVQLRRQQAMARQAASRSKQGFIEAATAFVREAGIAVPQRVSLESFVIRWIDENIPKDASAE